MPESDKEDWVICLTFDLSSDAMVANKAAGLAFLTGGGELGEQMRGNDWSQTAVGPPHQWPQSLRTAVSTCLNAHFPSLIWWGPDLLMLYNDAYRLILGDKHPRALGTGGQTVWPEIWGSQGPMLEGVLNKGEANWSENQLLMISGHGLPEAAYFSSSYSPIYDESDSIGGVFCVMTETTDTVLAQQQRQQRDGVGREDERNLATLFEQAPVGMAMLGPGPDFMVELANPFYCERYGRAAEQLLGKPLREALPELIGQGLEQRLMQVVATGVPDVSGETPVHLIRNARPETIYVDVVHQPRYASDRSITGVVVIVTDSTQAVRTRQRVESNERLLSTIIQQTPLGVGIFCGPDFIVELANPTVCQLWGRTHQQVMNKPLFTVLPEATGQGFEELLQGVFKTGIPFEGHELPVTLERNGQLETVYFDFVYDALRDVNGRIERTMVIATDVTQARKARQQIEASEARLRSLFAQAPVAIAIVRGPTFTVELANPGICLLWNRTEAQLLGNPVFAVLTESAGQGFEELLTGVLQTGVPFVGNEVPVLFLRDGQAQTVYVNFVYEPLRDSSDGCITGVVIVGTDVTEQVLTRQQTEQLLGRERELNELKSNFVTLASHEFRTPMGTILSSASLIGRYNGPDDGLRRERHVQRIKSAVHGLTGLLNDFLSLSQMEQSTLHGRPHAMNIVTFCQEVIDDMQALIKPDQHIVYTHLAGAPLISLDSQMLKNILINLLVNASKYSADGKQIELTTAVVDQQIRLTVRDEGIGIPDADKDKLFINFFRARNVNHVEGTGLGLYIVKRYVELLGGIVTFTSQLDSGTVFTVELPLSPLPL